MDEIRKIPPVTRTILGATGAITLPCILAITSPWRYALSWPLVISRFHLHRVVTCFFFGGSGLKLLFDVFLIFRNSTDLELNHFGRRTAAYTWALLVMGTVILATNYPLGSPILFGPMLNALVYLWSRANPHSSVSFFGMVNCPSRWLPYVYIGIDLLQGGPGLAIQSATGLIAGYVYWMLDQVLPGQQRRRRGSYIPTPGFLESLLPDSLDPSLEGQNMGNRNARRVAGGIVWNAARDRGNRLSDTGPASPRPTSIASALGAGTRSTLSALNPFRGSRSASQTTGPSREEMLAAAERRLRAGGASSIVGRNAAERTPAKPAGSNTPGSTSLNARPASTSTTAASANLRKTAAGSAQSNMFTFGQLNNSSRAQQEQHEEDHSSSGGAVAEQRRTPKGKAKARDSDDEEEAPPSAGYTWGSGGQRLGD
ncbi:DER1-domain-containing protein [Moesziomyces antarcticus]|uniref:Related to DFM1 - ER protein involved in ER-associated protein degradation n=2 Tax=Pseudozyma antarctica TaxID=84753 RepID=A0A5C3FJS3_PSEA2|nr:DER1-domain-containing protein [Moesziomyces antarcticus]GAK64169.1 DER1-domain-containing protein [Moesziomyces antarcticus]SPO44608.1 related to DFM1 - ER protein involved in ER-associated protein degradation [Moesziomyces antarcticus]